MFKIKEEDSSLEVEEKEPRKRMIEKDKEGRGGEG